MPQLILHQYAASPFSEKVRCLLGYKQQDYHMVEIPVIMPKPDLMALTGGYRKTPVLQIGADIFCDTAAICRIIDHLFSDNSIYPESEDALLTAAAHWTDTFLFKLAVAVAFQPKAVANSELFSDQEAAAAFMADRAALSEGSNELSLDLRIAQSHWSLYMRRLDNQLKAAHFIGGDQPNIVDFSTYHCCWFVYNNDSLKSELDQFKALAEWMVRMASFGQGNSEFMTGEDAVGVAKDSVIAPGSGDTYLAEGEPAPGDTVDIMPIDYGFQPTRGELMGSSIDEFVLKRVDERAGEVAVHFPRIGFQINPVGN
ncbi:MAG: glutathione S-transferase family protein [Candidatus Azotimanducaceae bacterium]